MNILMPLFYLCNFPTYWAARTITVVSIIAGSLIIANAWCRFVCPFGGIMELLRKISIFRISKTNECDNCDACLRVCEMGTMTK